jgi:cytochrome c oxidase subunit 1
LLLLERGGTLPASSRLAIDENSCAVHYWFPKMFGKMYSERWGLFASALVFMGFVLTFLPQFLLGNAGMPRRYYSYPEEYQWLNVLSTGGSNILALGLFIALWYLVMALIKGPKAPDDPWASRSTEWRTTSPPPKHNFEHEPKFVHGPYDYHTVAEDDPPDEDDDTDGDGDGDGDEGGS